ncbi:MAG: T9SS type A sorting domain-containing protein, partial [Chitinophagaceae bacterium]
TPVNVTTTPIPLKGARWNFISYLPQVNMTIKEALAGYKASDEDVIKSQTGFAMYSTQNGWIGSLNYLEPGKGYMIYRNRSNDTAFYYPKNNGSLTGRFSQDVNPTANERPVSANYRNAENMTIAAVVAGEFTLQAGDTIVAFVGGELRGKAIPIKNPEIANLTYFLNIGGEAEQPVLFMVQRGRDFVAQAVSVINYRSNTNMGKLSKPFELRFSKQSLTTTIYPNPFTTSTNLTVDLGGSQATGNHEVQVSIVDTRGRLMLQKAKEIVSGTTYKMSWNGKKSDGSDCANGIYFIHVVVDNIPRVYSVMRQ